MLNDRTEVRRVLDTVKAEGRTALTAPEGKIVCEAYGITVPKEGVATSAREAATIAADIGFPVVPNISSANSAAWTGRAFRARPFSCGLIGQTNMDEVTVDPDLVLRHADARVLDHRPRLDLVRPAMPRTRHDLIVVDGAFTQGAAVVQAQIVDGVKVVAEPEDSDVPSVDVHHFSGAGCEIAHAANGHEHYFVSL